MGGPSSLGLGLSCNLPPVRGPHLLKPKPSSTTSRSYPSSLSSLPSSLPFLSLLFSPPPFLCLFFFSLPSILKGRTEFPYGGHTQILSSMGRGPFQNLEPLLTSRVLASVVVERDKSWQTPGPGRNCVLEHMLPLSW